MEEVVKNTMKASTTRRSPLTVGPCMAAEAEKHTDGEIDALFSLTLKVCSIQWDAGLQGGNAVEAKFIILF
jgi:hypothetical protein